MRKWWQNFNFGWILSFNTICSVMIVSKWKQNCQTVRLNATQYYNRSFDEPGTTWEQIHTLGSKLLVRVARKGEGTLMCQWYPFWICTHKCCFQKMKNTRSPITQKPQLFTAWPLGDLVFSLIYSARIIKSWQLCFTVWRCVNTGCEQHVTALQTSTILSTLEAFITSHCWQPVSAFTTAFISFKITFLWHSWPLITL